MIKTRGYALDSQRVGLQTSLSIINKIEEIFNEKENPLQYSYVSNNELTQITFKHIISYYMFKGNDYDLIITGGQIDERRL